MSWLVYIAIVLVPLLTYTQSIDPFGIKTALVMITGFICLSYWLLKSAKWSSIPVFYLWCSLSFLWCPWKLGHAGMDLLLMVSYLGLFLYSRDYLTTIKIRDTLIISLFLTLTYNFYRVGIHFKLGEIGGFMFLNTNIFTGWLVMLIPLIFTIRKIFWAILLPFAFLALWNVGCRSSICAVGLGIALFSCFLWGRRGLIGGGVVLAILSIVFWIVFPHVLIDQAREQFWLGIITTIKSRPLFGYGIGSFRDVYPTFREMYGSGANPVHLLENAHNMFLQMTVETGLIGLGIFLSTVYVYFKRAVKNPINIALIIGIFSMLIDNLFNVSFYYVTTQGLFWVYLGLLSKEAKCE